MDKAEQMLEKHINENDLNFIFHEKKDLWQELLNAVNEALGLAHVGGSFFLSDLEKKLKIAKDEMVSENQTTQLKATGKMLAYKGILDGIKNGYY